MRLRRLFGRDEDSEGAADDVEDGDTERVASGSDGGSVAAEPPEVEEAPEGAAGSDDDDATAADVTALDADGDHARPDEGDGPDEPGRDRAPGADDAGADGDDRDADAAEGDFHEVEFELSEWGARERKLLDEILTGVRVRRVWQAGTLVVSTNDAEIVDDLIDEIEDRMALDLAPGVEPVVYDVRDWPDGLEDRLIEVLIEGRIPHLRGYQEVTVGVDDEERVDTLVEEVTTAWEDEQPSADELDGPDASDVLSELFVSSDRLLHDASDKTATVRFDDAASSVAALPLPFGFAEGDWTAIKDAVQVLRDRLGDAEAQDDDIEEAAASLRTLLRPLV